MSATAPTLARPALLVLALWAAIALAYGNSLGGEFVLDDIPHVVRNSRIAALWPPVYLKSNRFAVDATLALNRAAHGLDLPGYHVVNIAIHMAAAACLFGLARVMLAWPTLGGRYAGREDGLAFLIALLWAMHPLNTQAVTYIVQRAESLMGLCFLTAIACALRAAQANDDASRPAWRGLLWMALAGLAMAVGAGAKIVIGMAPFAMLAIDRALLHGALLRVLRRHLWAAIAASGMALAAGLWVTSFGALFFDTSAGATVGFSIEGISPRAYIASQPRVLAHYLALAIWPKRLLLDEAWPIAESWREWGPWAAAALAAIALTGYGLWRRRAWSLPAAWFLVILAPTSLIPVADLAVEHRMYLPLIGVVAGLVLAVDAGLTALTARLNRAASASGMGDASSEPKPGETHATTPATDSASLSALRRLGVVAALLAALALGLRTASRNLDYHDPLLLWKQAADARPQSTRARNNYGLILLSEGREMNLAAYHLEFAAERASLSERPLAYGNLARARLMQATQSQATGDRAGAVARRKQAVELLEKAVALDPRELSLRRYLGDAYLALRQFDLALQHYEHAAAHNHLDVDSQVYWAIALLQADRPKHALMPLERAVKVNAEHPEIVSLLGLAKARAGDMPGAAAAFKTALALDPQHAATLARMGEQAYRQGDDSAAEARLRQALALPLAPAEQAQARHTLALCLRRLGRSAEAQTHEAKARELEP